MLLHPPGSPPQKETARVTKNQQAAQVSRQADVTCGDAGDAIAADRLLAFLARRFSEFNCQLFPLAGGQLLLSSIECGGLTRVVPDVRAARVLLKQWEGR